MKVTWAQPNSSSFTEAPVMQTGASFLHFFMAIVRQIVSICPLDSERVSVQRIFSCTPSKGKNARCKVEENFSKRRQVFAEIVRCHVEGHISRSLICRWFRHAVLPEQPKLERAILNPKHLHHCEVCGRGFLTRSGKAKYCRDCAAKVHRKQKAESARKRRSGVDK